MYTNKLENVHLNFRVIQRLAKNMYLGFNSKLDLEIFYSCLCQKASRTPLVQSHRKCENWARAFDFALWVLSTHKLKAVFPRVYQV